MTRCQIAQPFLCWRREFKQKPTTLRSFSIFSEANTWLPQMGEFRSEVPALNRFGVDSDPLGMKGLLFHVRSIKVVLFFFGVSFLDCRSHGFFWVQQLEGPTSCRGTCELAERLPICRGALAAKGVCFAGIPGCLYSSCFLRLLGLKLLTRDPSSHSLQ